MTKIVLITPGQPSLNPRIVKEANALLEAGHWVTILYCHFIEWADKTDVDLLKQGRWEYKLVGGTPGKEKGLYAFTRIRARINRILSQLGLQRMLVAERSQARCYDELLQHAKKIKADWYIGHNLGALAVAIKAAAFHKAKAGFDFEDYYRGEPSKADVSTIKRVKFLEDKYVPKADYLTAGSDLIKEAVKKDFRALPMQFVPVYNCFPLKLQPAFRQNDDPNSRLDLFWFSQTIGTNRGLEFLVETLVALNDPSVHLTLAGRCNDQLLAYIDQTAQSINHRIHFAGIIPPDNLPSFAAGFDVGIAIELEEPLNRDICLTNKIFTYLLAGNAVVLSNTSMQKSFNDAYKIGQGFHMNDSAALVSIIKGYKEAGKLNNQKRHNYELARTRFNWEIESSKFLALIN